MLLITSAVTPCIYHTLKRWPKSRCAQCCPEGRLAGRAVASLLSSAGTNPAPVVMTPEEQAAKRAAQLERLAALPEHLRLGVTLPGACVSCCRSCRATR